MALPNSVPNLKQFMLKRRVLKLYKEFFCATRMIPSKKDRIEIQDWIRTEFKNKQNEKNIDAIKSLLHQGERSLREFEKTLSLSK